MTYTKDMVEKQKINEVLVVSYKNLEEKLKNVNERISKLELQLSSGAENTEKKGER